jgi:DnaB-like helicase C terminal domain
VNHAEEVLYAHLTEVDSLDVLAKERFSLESVQAVIPTELGRKLTGWALDYYFANGRKVAPTREAVYETWGDEMEKVEISLGDDTETDSVEWAIEQLRINYAVVQSQKFVKEFATKVLNADPTAKVTTIQEGAHELYVLSQSLISHHRESTADDGLEDALLRHEERATSGRVIQGLTLGLDPVDQHTHGIHDGELAILAAGSGVGKSWVGNSVTFNDWRRGRRAVLITLENDLDMTFDRMACAQARVDYERWQQGEARDDEQLRVKLLVEQLRESDHKPLVVMPERGDRTMMALVRKAVTMGGDSLIIDQLSFVEPGSSRRRQQGWEIIGDQMHELKSLINEGRERMPCLLLHQINRDGMAEAKKSGRHDMHHMAGAAEVERTGDHIWAIYQSADDAIVHQAKLQTLKGRRVKKKDWLLRLRLDVGLIKVISEVASV